MKYTYQQLEILCTTKNTDVELVRQKETGLLAVRKRLPGYLFPVYQKIRKIRHRNLVQIYEVERQQSQCIVIEEYVDGEPLAEFLEREGTIASEQAAQYLYALCGAVCALHKQDIVHRDINPNNIMITRDGIVKLGDYNISQMIGQDGSPEAETVGTVGYAPVEQYGYGMTDVQSDIYAMGRTANKLLTGSEDGSYQADETDAWFEEGLSKIVSQMVSFDKTERYETADLALEDFEMLLYDDYQEKEWLTFFSPKFRRGAHGMRLAAVGVVYIVLGCVQYYVWYAGGCSGSAGLVLCVLAWLIFFDFLWISRRIFRLNRSRRWFRYVIGLIIMLAAALVEGW